MSPVTWSIAPVAVLVRTRTARATTTPKAAVVLRIVSPCSNSQYELPPAALASWAGIAGNSTAEGAGLPRRLRRLAGMDGRSRPGPLQERQFALLYAAAVRPERTEQPRSFFAD